MHGLVVLLCAGADSTLPEKAFNYPQDDEHGSNRSCGRPDSVSRNCKTSSAMALIGLVQLIEVVNPAVQGNLYIIRVSFGVNWAKTCAIKSVLVAMPSCGR